MNGKLTIECGLGQLGEVMLCGDCRKATTLFRERCMACGCSKVFTVQDVFDSRVNLAEFIGAGDLNWIANVIDELFAGLSTGSTTRIAA